MPSLTELVQQLHVARETEKQAKAAYDAKLAELPELKALEDAKKQAVEIRQGVEEKLRETAVKADSAGETVPDGIEVKTFTVYGYDSDEARTWCLQNMTLCLSLNVKLFDEFVKIEGLRPSFVEEQKTRKATIARDLSQHIAAPDGAEVECEAAKS